MAISMYDASVLVFQRGLTSLEHVLDKALADATQRRIDPQVLLAARLAPDMLPLTRQVQIAADHAKNAVGRLAGVAPPKFDDNETDFAQLKQRLARSREYLATFQPAQVDGSEERDIVLQFPGREFKFKGLDYLLGFAIPNFYFHYTTAYDILRHNGVPLGKADFIGGAPR